MDQQQETEREYSPAELLQMVADNAAAAAAIRALVERMNAKLSGLRQALCDVENAESFAWNTLRETAHERPAAIREVSGEMLASIDRANARMGAIEDEVRAVLAALPDAGERP